MIYHDVSMISRWKSWAAAKENTTFFSVAPSKKSSSKKAGPSSALEV